MRVSAMLFVRFLLLVSIVWGTPARGQHPVINEFMASNFRAAQDESGDYDDWIEIYNPSSQSVDIGGMYLTDRLSNPTKWQIPRGQPCTDYHRGPGLPVDLGRW